MVKVPPPASYMYKRGINSAGERQRHAGPPPVLWVFAFCMYRIAKSINQPTQPQSPPPSPPSAAGHPPLSQTSLPQPQLTDTHTNHHTEPHQKKGDRTTITCPADCRAHPLGTGTPTKVQLTARSSIPGRWSGSPVPCTSSGAKRGGTAYRKAAGGFGACRSRRWCGPVEREGLTPPTHRDRLGRNWLLLL